MWLGGLFPPLDRMGLVSCLQCGVPAQCRTGPRARTQGLLPLLQAVVSRNVPALFAATSLRLVGDSILKLCSM